jgi:hypothetical protein
MQSTLIGRLADKTLTKKELLQKAENDPALISALIEGTSSPKASIRYGCGAVLMELSEKQPCKVYPYWNSIVKMLDSKHRILTWNALAVIANLTQGDKEGKFDQIFDRYFGFLGSEYMVTVANTVGYSAIIAESKPYLADKILAELLKVNNLKTTPHLTEECKLVIAEKALETFDTLIDHVQNRQAIIDFAEKYQNSSRVSLQKQAQKYVRKWIT